MKALSFTLLCLTVPLAAVADSTEIDTAALPKVEAYGVAQLTPLALSDAGSPSIVLLDLEAGDVVPPHSAEAGLRYLTVLSGDVSWGNGTEVVEAEELVYGPGTLLTVPAGDPHWLAARGGPVTVQVIVLQGEEPVPALAAQMQ